MPLRLTSLRGEKHPAVVFASFASHLQKSSQKKKKNKTLQVLVLFVCFLRSVLFPCSAFWKDLKPDKNGTING